ncbi:MULTISPECIES: SGNH/GDSL hydrolase family protein [Streptomyces]|uniref:SGNH/GDSL hydrolase family protein n=1 Tax=Streptomyces TaxID=1883 RepID=UPI00158703D2|nr:SGNH/GDSL hydrolase family protein [Streptomyces sp. CAI-85]MBO7934682.1 SGNH/GDSL hydrolase family protein [Streptomyces sp. S9]NUV59640.1 SGNH/GDSL hydrolase family protein [Streptomyces sp. CAI-85]
MKLRRIISAVLASLLTAGLALTSSGTAQAAGEEYVALGDSYSSGVGAGDYLPESGSCLRSKYAYPSEYNRQRKPSKFSFMACSGATTVDVLNTQLGPLNASTTLVSVGAGGNDAGFSDVIRTCVLNITDSACISRINQARDFANRQLPGRLDALYNAIKQRAPKARVVVLGVAQLYTLDNGFCAGISNTKRKAINDAADLLNSIMSGRAAAHGFRWGNVQRLFSGHAICSDQSYLWDVNFTNTTESYHPNMLGQRRGYYEAFVRAAG